MNTDKVFTGFNNENKEILVYRENNESYIDLINKKIVYKDNIETLKYESSDEEIATVNAN